MRDLLAALTSQVINEFRLYSASILLIKVRNQVFSGLKNSSKTILKAQVLLSPEQCLSRQFNPLRLQPGLFESMTSWLPAWPADWPDKYKQRIGNIPLIRTVVSGWKADSYFALPKNSYPTLLSPLLWELVLGFLELHGLSYCFLCGKMAKFRYTNLSPTNTSPKHNLSLIFKTNTLKIFYFYRKWKEQYLFIIKKDW